MRRMTFLTAFMVGLFAPSLFAACQSAPTTGSLAQQLQATYSPTKMDASGVKVAEPGCILVVQMDGIAACTSTKTAIRNVYEEGQIKVETKNSLVNLSRKVPLFGGRVPDAPACPGGTRNYMMGEKVYLLNTEIRDNGKDAGVVFSVQSCGACDPSSVDPAHRPYHADIRVSLIRGFSTNSDLKQIEKAVGEILAFPEDTAADDQKGGQGNQSAAPASQPATQPAPAPQQPAQQTTFAPIAPPPPPAEETPAAAPVNVEIGQTPDQVKAALGQPEKIVKVGSKEIYSYRSLKVTFVNGKVADID